MDLYCSRTSGNSSRAAFALYESKAAWRPRLIDPRGGENRSAEYLSLNPMGKLPALVDGAFHLWESNAINWYVAEKHPEARLLPASAEGRASTQRWLMFQAGHVSPACAPVFMLGHARMQTFWSRKGDPQAAETGRKELARFLPVLEAALSGRDWLEGDFSLADIAYAPHFALLDEVGFEFGSYPSLRAWLDRLLARSAWKQTRQLIFD